MITGQPQSVTVAQNSPASFTVTATGVGLTYQWRFGGVPIGGATGATYAIASAQPSQAGEYDVVVSNGKARSRVRSRRSPCTRRR